jgi:hypothetical protein
MRPCHSSSRCRLLHSGSSNAIKMLSNRHNVHSRTTGAHHLCYACMRTLHGMHHCHDRPDPGHAPVQALIQALMQALSACDCAGCCMHRRHGPGQRLTQLLAVHHAGKTEVLYGWVIAQVRAYQPSRPHPRLHRLHRSLYVEAATE